MSLCKQAPGLSYDQSQIGMLSVSFLDATHHSTHHHHPPPLTAEAGDLMSVSALDQSLLPINLTRLPAVQGGPILLSTGYYNSTEQCIVYYG